ncbi:hypothetical protein M2302_004279 [Micromonospora sp. A200]|nr:hypothetical protein [Micromonospora sp. A200]
MHAARRLGLSADGHDTGENKDVEVRDTHWLASLTALA